MNSRVRARGYSAKEIAFQRDQVSNESKLVSDEKLSKEQVKRRQEQHPSSGLAKVLSRFEIGDNVFLKNDKSKLRGREMYKIVDTFESNNEKWAKIQKSENQFRAKQYDAKFSELILIPGTRVSELSPDNIQEEKGEISEKEENFDKKNDDLEKDTEVISEDRLDKGVEKEPKAKKGDDQSDNLSSRKRRKSALKNQDRIKELASRGLLKVSLETGRPPKHAWNWEEFNSMVENEISITNKVVHKEVNIIQDQTHEPAENLFLALPYYDVDESVTDEDIPHENVHNYVNPTVETVAYTENEDGSFF